MIDVSGRPPAWPSEAVELWGECVRRAVRRAELWRVPAPQGDEVLREALGEHLGLDPVHLTITASLRAAVLTYARRYRRFLLECPTYPGVVETAVAAGADVAFQSWPDLLADADAAPPPEPVLRWLTAPCRNPDGAELSAADRERLTALAASGQRVVVNGTYAWFVTRPSWPEGVDIAGSLHKLCGVGARLGWVYSPTYFEEAFAEMLGTTPSRVWQHAWGLFLRRGGLSALRDRLIDPSLEAAAAFRARLHARGASVPDFAGTNALVPLAAGVDEATALATLAELGFQLCPAAPFRCPAPALRVSFTGIPPVDAVHLADALAGSGVLAGVPTGTPIDHPTRTGAP